MSVKRGEKISLALLYLYYFATLKGLPRRYVSELVFWENHLAKRDGQHGMLEMLLNQETREGAFPAMMLANIKALENEFGEKRLSVLEIGPGPTSHLAWGVDQGLIDVTALDPLADYYDAMMRKNHYNYPIKPRKGTGENIPALFSNDSFHICFSGNALDHTADPEACIANMYDVLKKGGILHITGRVKEGTSEQWRGLHRHDITLTDGDLIITNKAGEQANPFESLNFKQIYGNIQDGKIGDFYIMIYKKI